MREYTEKIREIAKRLLENKTVDVFIGYRKGTVAMMNEPLLIQESWKGGASSLGQQLRAQPM